MGSDEMEKRQLVSTQIQGYSRDDQRVFDVSSVWRFARSVSVPLLHQMHHQYSLHQDLWSPRGLWGAVT